MRLASIRPRKPSRCGVFCEVPRIRSVGLGDSSFGEEGCAFRHPQEARGRNPRRGLRPGFNTDRQPRRCESRSEERRVGKERRSQQSAAHYKKYPEYEAWGWEIHHSAKRDAPSGTLKKLAEEIRASGYGRTLTLTANRAGAHPGTHEIGFDSAGDTITLRHTARSREGFARGALQAARWVAGKRGVFEFREILGELA